MAESGKLTLTLRIDDAAVLETEHGEVVVRVIGVARGRAELCFEAPRDINISRRPRKLSPKD